MGRSGRFYGQTLLPLDAAMLAYRPDMFELLLVHGAKLEDSTLEGGIVEYALWKCLTLNDHDWVRAKEIVLLLVRRGLNLQEAALSKKIEKLRLTYPARFEALVQEAEVSNQISKICTSNNNISNLITEGTKTPTASNGLPTVLSMMVADYYQPPPPPPSVVQMREFTELALMSKKELLKKLSSKQSNIFNDEVEAMVRKAVVSNEDPSNPNVNLLTFQQSLNEWMKKKDAQLLLYFKPKAYRRLCEFEAELGDRLRPITYNPLETKLSSIPPSSIEMLLQYLLPKNSEIQLMSPDGANGAYVVALPSDFKLATGTFTLTLNEKSKQKIIVRYTESPPQLIFENFTAESLKLLKFDGFMELRKKLLPSEPSLTVSPIRALGVFAVSGAGSHPAPHQLATQHGAGEAKSLTAQELLERCRSLLDKVPKEDSRSIAWSLWMTENKENLDVVRTWCEVSNRASAQYTATVKALDELEKNLPKSSLKLTS